MDDTLLLSTTRNGILNKLSKLNDFCVSQVMKINTSKTKFMVINGNIEDKKDIIVKEMCAKLCKYYVYLDNSFTTISFPSISIK